MIRCALLLVAAGLNDIIPERGKLEMIITGGSLPEIFKWADKRGVAGIIATILDFANQKYSDDEQPFIEDEIMEPWDKARAEIIRRNTFFDLERADICDWMDSQGIWYVPLKGIVLQKMYPRLGMRNMVDNDILFDDSYGNELRQFMIQRGYHVDRFGCGHDDGYTKAPFFNFEMHRSSANENLLELLDAEHRLSDEAFFVHLIDHAHHHYRMNGIGIRALADIYIYAKAKPSLNRAEVSRLLELRGIAEFGEKVQILANKLFGEETIHCGIPKLDQSELEMLSYMMNSAIIGSYINLVNKYISEAGGNTVLGIWRRAFPPFEKMQRDFHATRLTLPYWYIHRLILRRKYIKIELKHLWRRRS